MKVIDTNKPPILPSTKKKVRFLWAALAIVVVAGLILSFVLPTIIQDSGGYKITKAAKAQMSVIETALAAHRLDNLSYPSSLDGLVENISNKHSWQGPYLTLSQLRDPWGEKFKYKMPGTEGRDFDLYSLGADKKEGGKGNDADVKH